MNFQNIILKLQEFWANNGCVIFQPYDLEKKGAGTFHPGTFLRCLGNTPWSTAYVEPCRRPMEDMEKIRIDFNITINFK